MILRAYLNAVAQRAEAATKGPWDSPLRDLGAVKSFAEVDFYFDQSYEAYPPLGESGPVFVTPTKENAEFLTHARTDLPRLVQMLQLAAEALEHTAQYPGDAWSSCPKALAALDALAAPSPPEVTG
jgi:hypothetical protein